MESESEAELSANQKTHYQSLSNLEQEKNGGSRGKTGRGCETVPRWDIEQVCKTLAITLKTNYYTKLTTHEDPCRTVERTKFPHKVPKFALTFPL